MTSCTIIVSHFESPEFLHACIREIRNYKHPEIEQHIIIADQSCRKIHNDVAKEYWNNLDVTVEWMREYWSGYGIDHIVRHCDIESEFICQIHVDVVPISRNWLYLPIVLIKENNFSFVGQLQCISKPTDTIYPPGKPFFAMAQSYNVARTKTYLEMSLEAGFTRFHNRERGAIVTNNNDWYDWAKADYNARGSDDDIVAFWWESNYRDTDKLGLAITGFVQPNFGRVIEDLVFHFGSCRESLGVTMSYEYNYYTERIKENYDEALISEMVAKAKNNIPPELQILSRNHWDGKLKVSNPPSEKLNKRIEELKHETK